MLLKNSLIREPTVKIIMPTTQPSDKLDITLLLVIELIAEQFPQWAHLPIRPTEVSGVDNRTFRLGQDMVVRLPSSQQYALQVQKEQRWLPFLAQHLSIPIPEPLAIGQPSKHYPWHWSTYRWIEGQSANILSIDEEHLKLIVKQLAQFLNELHTIDTTGAPLPGSHNFYRGGSLSVYDDQTRDALDQLRDQIDVDAVTVVWERALRSQWNKDPVWIHGDLYPSNILIKDGQLTAVIDFGGMGIGDPACDLVIAWTFLKNESRNIFKLLMNLDSDTWARARGWALWKALITLAQIKDKNGSEALKQKRLIDDLLLKS